MKIYIDGNYYDKDKAAISYRDSGEVIINSADFKSCSALKSHSSCGLIQLYSL